MCACKNANCCRNKTPDTLPKEELSIPAVVDIASKIVQQLTALKNAGINFLPEEINVMQLTNTLQALMLENNALRGLLDRFGPPTIEVDNASATIIFGPNQNYKLQLAVGNAHERDLLAAQFRAAADKLVGPLHPDNKTPLPNQQSLPFKD